MLMMENKAQLRTHISKIEDDLLFHLCDLLTDLGRIQIDYNRDSGLLFKAKSLTEKVLLIIQLYERQDKPVFRALKTKINKMIAENPHLKGIIVHIENSRCIKLNGKIERIKLKI